MRAVIQRVACASVEVDNKMVSSIKEGLLALVGFHHEDDESDCDYIINKIFNLRILGDDNDLMNLSLLDCEKELLVVSQFTLYGDARKGRRPSFSEAMPPDRALQFYNNFIELCKLRYNRVVSGVFGADMKVNIVNSGPVTILLDSTRLF